MTGPKSLSISYAVSINGTEVEIWAGFGPVGSTEKKCYFKFALIEFRK